MTINLNVLDPKSVKNAIAQIQYVKKFYPNMVKELLESSRVWIAERANGFLDASDIGDNVKATIKSQWDFPPIVGNVCLLVNRDSSGQEKNKAVFVEFGVGSVGGSQPHPLALENGYLYNVPSPYKGKGKKDPDEWSFDTNLESLDIPQKNITKAYSKGEKLHVYTKGARGVFFLFNALTEFRVSGQAQIIWQKIKEKYIK